MMSPAAQHNELMRLDAVGIAYPQRKKGLRREDYWVFKDVSFSIFQGETVGVLGRNGAGKSTLLRLLSDIIRPDAGKVVRAPGLSTTLLSIQAGFLSSLTGRQNALISGITLGLSKSKIESCMDAIIEFSELGGFIDQPVATYSSGMRARLGFSIAMQVDPNILLIDEVISVGDEGFRQKSSAFIKRRVELNETTVLVTHNVQLARSLCTRVIWIDGGEVRMNGAPGDVIGAYLGE